MVNIERAIKDIGRPKKYLKNELLFSAQQKANAAGRDDLIVQIKWRDLFNCVTQIVADFTQ